MVFCAVKTIHKKNKHPWSKKTKPANFEYHQWS